MTRQKWHGEHLFILAAIGAAVGLGNIWKFPYIVGENGGSAFILVYLLCIALIGFPLMFSEILIGKYTQMNPIMSIGTLVKQFNLNPLWRIIGWSGSIAGLLILSYYSVIAGWTMHYSINPSFFIDNSAEIVSRHFNELLSNPMLLLSYHSVFLIIIFYVVSKGVTYGIERLIRYCMPILLMLLIILMGYAFYVGDVKSAANFMFAFNYEDLSLKSCLNALGHAFFSLSIGMGTIMVYGSYVNKDVSIVKSGSWIIIVDTIVAIVSGMIIFPIVFSQQLEPAAGPGLLFETLPLAISQMPGSTIVGTVFFVLVFLAALTSAISLIEPMVSYLTEKYNGNRRRVTLFLILVIWFLGVGTILSFNIWEDYTMFSLTFFEVVDKLTANIMLPITGFLTALFIAYALPLHVSLSELNFSGAMITIWKIMVGVLAPLGVVFVVLSAFFLV